MTSFNGTTVINRGNRPSPTSPCKLDFFWVKEGSYTDPYQVCSVHIFPDTKFGTANQYVNLDTTSSDYGLVSSTDTNYLFHNYKRDGAGNRIGFQGEVSACAAESAYTGDLRYSASSIFKVKTGHFAVILQPSAVYFPASVTDFNMDMSSNTASGTGNYLDIWTIKDVVGSKAQIYVNSFKLNSQSVVAVTEPMMVTPNNKLVQRYIEVGSKRNLQMKTELVVDNEPIRESLRNLLETGSLLQNQQFRIVKLNESPDLSSRVVIKDFGDTASTTNINANGTMSYLWDTANITPKYSDDILGGSRGVYEITAKYTILDETYLSPKFKLIVR